MQKKNQKKKKILILGSNSFSANTCANYLLAKNYTVIGISRLENFKLSIIRLKMNIITVIIALILIKI